MKIFLKKFRNQPKLIQACLCKRNLLINIVFNFGKQQILILKQLIVMGFNKYDIAIFL